jgi:hypothetical protein
MGHPGAPNHDHHRSFWFAHQSINGHDFWSDGKGNHVRQKMWYGYQGGRDEAIMATLSGWYDRTGKELMEQDIIAALIPLTDGEHALELQITMRPGGESQTVELGKTNFGFLAVRVAKSLSVHFGGGKLTSSEGMKGEAEIFGRQSRWVDYSGPVAVGSGPTRTTTIEGITYFDHPDNPRYPTFWHVREDGWMGAAFCLREGLAITRDQPLTLRYLLHAHSGGYHGARAEALHASFAARPELEVAKSTRPHYQYTVRRKQR